MRSLVGEPFDSWRDRSDRVMVHYGSAGDETCGVFMIPPGSAPSGKALCVIASQGGGWDHISITYPGSKKPPVWADMSWIKRQFFLDGEWAVEYHPPPPANISVHDGCLHIWRPNDGRAIPTPPGIYVGA